MSVMETMALASRQTVPKASEGVPPNQRDPAQPLRRLRRRRNSLALSPIPEAICVTAIIIRESSYQVRASTDGWFMDRSLRAYIIMSTHFCPQSIIRVLLLSLEATSIY